MTLDLSKSFNRKPGIITEKWWERTVKEAFKNDPIRIIIELIKNSADSYTQLEKKENIKPPFKILVEFSCWPRKAPFIKVKDFAQGMDSEKLEKALAYGAETSLEDKEGVTSAEKGIGLKDAMMAMEENRLVTIKEDKLNERTKYSNFDTGEGHINYIIKKEDRIKIGIPENGTIVQGRLPEYFPDKKFNTICKHLANHYMMYKLVQIDNFDIVCVDTSTKEELTLSKLYDHPKIDKKFEVIKKDIVLPYQNRDYHFLIEIKKSNKPLEFGKPYGKAGLYFYYGNYTVLDFSFGNSRYPEMRSFFGEIRMVIEPLVRKGELFVDEKRKGLSDHSLNEELLKEIDKIVAKIADEQREVTSYVFKKESWMQEEMQKIYQDIIGKGKKSFQLPIKPKKFEFATPHTDVMEFEPKNIFLIINCSIISSGIEISLLTKNQNLDIISPSNKKIIIKEGETDESAIEKDGEKFIVRIIKVYSEKKDSEDEIIARLDGYHSSKIGISLISNPIFNPREGFEFAPKENGEVTINEGATKKIDLVISQSLYDEKDRKIRVDNSHEGIKCAGNFEIPTTRNLEIYKLKNVIRYPFEILSKPGETEERSGKIKAFYKNKETELKINVISPGGINFKGVKFVKSEGTQEISDYKDDGYVYIYQNHPLVKKYKKGDWQNKNDCLTFLADIISREFIEKTIRESIKSGRSKFQIINQDNPELEIRQHFVKEYYEKSERIHGIQITYLKTAELR
ncbi:MAG: ATP-binding protein [Candidatus Nanoarchaeia archaeon]|nr:ATP-binding protein [Candidatus Nanoarchaeia archaeon]